MTIEELKASDIKDLKVLAYDQIALLEQAQQNLKVINQIISEKQQLPKPEEKPIG